MTKGQPSCRAIVVDDSRDGAESFCKLLESVGCEMAYMVTDAEHALPAIETAKPHVAFLEVEMPNISGWDLAGIIRSTHRPERLRLVATVRRGARIDVRRAEAAGFDGHLVHPATPESVKGMLDRLFPARREQ